MKLSHFALRVILSLIAVHVHKAQLSGQHCRLEFEDKKEYLNELSKQQFDLAATTHYTTNRSEVSWHACMSMQHTVSSCLHIPLLS